MSEQLSVANLVKQFQVCGDVKQEYFQVKDEQIHVFYCEGMLDETLLFQTILPELRRQLKNALTNEKNEANKQQANKEVVDSTKSAEKTEQIQAESKKADNPNQQTDRKLNLYEVNKEQQQVSQEGEQSANIPGQTNDDDPASKGEQQDELGEQKHNTSLNQEANLSDQSDQQNNESNDQSRNKQEQSEQLNSTYEKNASNNQDTTTSKEASSEKQSANKSQDSNEVAESSKNKSSSIGQNIKIEDFMLPGLKEVTTVDEALEQVFRGNCVVVLKESELFWSVQTADQPNRQPEESSLEVSVKGPRDNFVENTTTNIALVRKRLPTNALAVEKMVVGERSKTNVAILYFQDIVDKKILEEMKQEIQNVNTDVIFSGELLMESVSKQMIAVPRYEYTGRPDFVVQSLARGRYAVFVEGSAYAMVTPVNFWFLVKSGEDNEYPVAYASFQRVLRLVGLLIGLLLPAFWLALTTFHQNQLPLQLLATVVQSNTGLPFPSAVEMILMLLFFELFREAGLRMPTVIGGTISVVGGLIIGDAAIRAGITSPAMVVVIALSTIATFTLVNQSVVGLVSLLRIIYIAITAICGLFGFFASLFMSILFLANIKVFGVPYLNVAADLNVKTFLKTFFRMNHDEYAKRPEALKTKDKHRTRRSKGDM